MAENKFAQYETETGSLTPSRFNTWKPEAGDSIVGEVVALEPNKGKNSDSTVAEIVDGKGEQHSVWLSAVLLGEFQRQRIRVGDVVGIKFLGRETNPKSGREYKSYGLKIFERSDIPF